MDAGTQRYTALQCIHGGPPEGADLRNPESCQDASRQPPGGAKAELSPLGRADWAILAALPL